MDRGAAGTSGESRLTSGELAVTSGVSPATRRRALIAVLLALAALQGTVNGVSRLSDLRGAGADVAGWTIAVDEASSLCAWFVCMALVWRLVAVLQPPRVAWPVAALLHVLATVPVSLLHVALMVLLREGAYGLAGTGYVFAGDGLLKGLVYEYRKDAPVYFILAAAFAGIRWSTRPPAPEGQERILVIHDGTRRIRLPHARIDRVEAAGNYVEIHSGGEAFLHRATTSAIGEELGPAFARIHRSRLVRRDAIRATEGLPSGDFILTLADGTEVRGSRRYRGALE